MTPIGAGSVDAVVVTQKDLVKLGTDALGERPLWAVEIAAVVTTGEEHWQAAIERVAGLKTILRPHYSPPSVFIICFLVVFGFHTSSHAGASAPNWIVPSNNSRVKREWRAMKRRRSFENN